LISIAANSLLFAAIGPVQAWPVLRRFEAGDDPLSVLPDSVDTRRLVGLVVLVGHGRVGKRIAAQLREAGIPYIVVEQNRELVEALRADGVHAVCGDAADPAVLVQSHVAQARLLVVASPDTFSVRQMAETARALNPGIEVVARTHSDEEAALLQGEQVARAFVGENELAQGMAAHVLLRWRQGAASP
jgi:monovalent cation:H+ antiporter-2, CPA2 family